MFAPKPTIEEQIEALAILREFAATTSHNSLNELSRNAAEAINTLDNADLFTHLDDARDQQEITNEDRA
jgi:hypothetical protein